MIPLKEYLYQKIYNELRQKIENGIYAQGQILPTERELVEKYKVSLITVKKAVNMLAEDGFVTKRPGHRTYADKENQPRSKNRRGGRRIGLTMPNISETFNRVLIASIITEAEKNDIYVIVGFTDNSMELESKLIENFILNNVEFC